MFIARTFNAFLLALGVASLSGCYDFSVGADVSANFDESQIEGYTYQMKPTVPANNVKMWWFEFKDPFMAVEACNDNGNNYSALSWSLSGTMITIKYSNQEYEYYTLRNIADDLSSGDFDYDNSVAGTTPVSGRFTRLPPGSNECPK